MPRVTVVTAAYNAAPYVAETIESVLAQTYADVEYVVVDDGSTDGTAEIVRAYLPQLTYIRQENAGEGAARNTAFERATGEYIAIVDADDVWEPEKLERQVAAMDGHPEAGLCYTNCASIDEDGAVIDPWIVAPHAPLTSLMALGGRNPLVTSTVLYRRRFLEARPYGSLPVAADFHVHLKVLWRSHERAVFVDEPLARYRIVQTSALRRSDPWVRGACTLAAVDAFVDDVEAERPVPRWLRRRGRAHAHYGWAWYCIAAHERYAFALRTLARATWLDPRLAGPAARQVVKAARNAIVDVAAR